MLSLIKRFRLFAIVVAAAVSVAAISGCGSSSSSTSNTLLRVADTVSDGTATIFNNGVAVAPAQTFFQSSKFFSTTPGVDSLTFSLSSAPVGVTYPAISQTLSTGTPYTAMLFGRADVTVATDARFPKLVVTADDRTIPDTNKSRVRIVHAGPDLAACDVALNSKALVTNVGYLSIGSYADVDAGNQVFAVTLNGAGTAVAGGTFTFNSGQLYTVYILESLSTGSPVYSIQVTNDSNATT
ncbi:MAG TPA: DUF4397 domain-containing protein [Capsulimonadaceae bacterium]|jgi:hypothetical protein